MVYIGATQNRTENVFRLLEVEDTKGNVLRLIANRFDLEPDEISGIYRQRWAIELFLKWLKQHVKIKHFYGMSETAIQNQIYLALITYCLNVLIQLEMKSKKPLFRISRWLSHLFGNLLIFGHENLIIDLVRKYIHNRCC